MCYTSKKGVPYGLLTFAILWLMYDVYYWSMRSSAGVLRNTDIIVCIASGLISIALIIFVVIKQIKRNINKKESAAK